MSEDLKHACHECGGRIGYPADAFGATIHCPHCGKQTTLGEIYPDAPEVPVPVQTKRLPQSNIPPVQVQQTNVSQPTRQRSQTLLILAVGSVLAIIMVVLFVLSGKRAETAKQEAAVAAEQKAKHEAIKLAADTAARQEAEKAKQKADSEEKANAIAKAVAEAKAQAIAKAAADAATAAKMEIERKAKSDAERKERLRSNPAAIAIWEESDQEAIRIMATRVNDATVRHKTTSVNLKYEDMPDWLRVKTQNAYREEGESKGLIREIDGKVYDLRANPAGWVSIPSARVIQIVDEGYLMINEATSGSFKVSVFKLKHNGLARILNDNDRVQVTGFSAGLYTYNTKGGDVKTVPVYDPGMPVGAGKDKVVQFK